VIVARGRQIAIRRAAVTLAMLLVVAFAAPEILGFATSTSAYVTVNSALTEDVPVLVVAAVPGLLTIFIQWWIVTSYLFGASRRGET
jgi:hypothetical protein